jgi:hypothetical protein
MLGNGTFFFFKVWNICKLLFESAGMAAAPAKKKQTVV